jgi:hypothetical protein
MRRKIGKKTFFFTIPEIPDSLNYSSLKKGTLPKNSREERLERKPFFSRYQKFLIY